MVAEVGSRTVLLVDDVPVDRSLLARVFRRAGHRVLEAAHGAEALFVVAADPPDLVVSDGQMPILDGYQLCRILKDDPGTRHLPVILLTGQAEGLSRFRARTCGADRFLLKGGDPREVVAAAEDLAGTAGPLASPRASYCPEDLGLEDLQKRLGRALEHRLLETAMRDALGQFYALGLGAEDLLPLVLEFLHDLVLPGAVLLAVRAEGGAWSLGRHGGEVGPATLARMADAAAAALPGIVPPAWQLLPPLREEAEPLQDPRLTTLTVGHPDSQVQGCMILFLPRAGQTDRGRLFEVACHELGRLLDHAEVRRRLAEREANLRTMFETIDDLVMVVDPQLRILHANRAAAARLGFRPGELEGQSIRAVHPEDHQPEVVPILEALERDEHLSATITFHTRTGEHLPMETRLWRTTWNGTPCILGVSMDRSREVAALDRFNRLFNLNPCPMAVTDVTEQRFLQVNRAFQEVLGYDPAEVLGRTREELGLFEDPGALHRALAEVERPGGVRNHELRLHARDGRAIDGLFSGVVVDGPDRRELLTVMMDITESARLKREMENQAARLAAILESTNAGTWEWNVQTGETTFNERWAEILGLTLADLAPVSIETWTRLTHPEDLAESDRQLQEHFAGHTPFYACQARMRHRTGEWVWVLDHGRVTVRDAGGRPLLMTGTHIDITEMKMAEERIRELSVRDPLTGLFNRRYFFERLEPLLERCRRGLARCALAVLDLDHFKRVNDTHGHLLGDEVLRRLAGVLGRNSRPYDLVARFGGEEFILAFEGLDRQEAAAAVERMLEAMRAETWGPGAPGLKVTFSCGAAGSEEFAPGALVAEAMIARADERLYRAKDLGRDRVVTGLD